MHCKRCGEIITDKYCGHCGSPAFLTRVDGHYIAHEVQHLLHFEKGLLYTVKELLLRPGKSMRTFITEDRSRLVKPVVFIIITSVIYTFIAHFFHIDKKHVDAAAGQSAIAATMAWVEGHYGYANIIMGIFIGAWLKLLFLKSKYNFFEVIIMLCFVMGVGMLLFAAFAVVDGLAHINSGAVASTIAILYCTWAIGQFFNPKKVTSYLLAFIGYILGMITFWIAAMLVGLLVSML
jgi:hypothetical protein